MDMMKSEMEAGMIPLRSCATMAESDPGQLLVSARLRPMHWKLRSGYLVNLDKGPAAVCALIIVDLRAFLDLVAKDRAANALVELRLLLSQFPHLVESAIPSYWSDPSESLSDFGLERRRPDAWEGDNDNAPTSRGITVYPFRRMQPSLEESWKKAVSEARPNLRPRGVCCSRLQSREEEKMSVGTENLSRSLTAASPPLRPLMTRLLREGPYLGMLTMALIGVGMESFTGRSMDSYWLILAPLYAVMCIVAGWKKVDDKERRLRLVWKQGLHWLAFLVAMLLVTSPEVRGVENNNAAGLNLMTILASGTFVAGVHAEAWQICVVGALLVLSVPAIAWVEQSALLISLLIPVLALLAIGPILWAAHTQKG